MTAIGKNQLLLGRILTPDEVLSRIDSVTLENVYELCDQIFEKEKATIAIVSREDLTEKIQGIF